MFERCLFCLVYGKFCHFWIGKWNNIVDEFRWAAAVTWKNVLQVINGLGENP